MRKFAFGFACVVAGCAVGAAMPRIAAQTFPSNPAAPKWQQVCEYVGRHGADSTGVERLSQLVASRGRDGWELAGVFVPSEINIGVCFKRPAP